jgi:hypothetical protein
LRGLGGDGWFGSTLPNRRPHVGAAVEFEWTKRLSQAHFDDANLVKSVVFPAGVFAIGEESMSRFEALESVVLTVDCIDVDDFAFAGCKALKAISLPIGGKEDLSAALTVTRGL